jgi:hypothetical protein
MGAHACDATLYQPLQLHSRIAPLSDHLPEVTEAANRRALERREISNGIAAAAVFEHSVADDGVQLRLQGAGEGLQCQALLVCVYYLGATKVGVESQWLLSTRLRPRLIV